MARPKTTSNKPQIAKNSGQTVQGDNAAGRGRTRNFATLVYPTEEEYNAYYQDCGGNVVDQNGELHHVEKYDGADGWGTHPPDWKEKLNAAHVPALISPMHIGDVNPDGKPKKPHWHVLLMYEGVKQWETQVKPLFDSIGGVGREQVNSARGYARYLCHLDNPEKCQYSPQDVTAYAGANFEIVTHLPTDDVKTLQEVFRFIRANEIYSLAELMDILADNNPEWFMLVAMNRTYTVGEYIKSLTWERSAGYVRVTDRQADTADNTAGKESTT